jgi:hypothetical protein
MLLCLNARPDPCHAVSIAALLGVLLCAPALAAEKVAGSATFSMTHPLTIPVGESGAEHTLWHTLDRASRIESSGELCANCATERTTTCDIVRGRGSCFGYQTALSSEGDRLITKYSGGIEPQSGDDPKATDLSLRGTWVVISGSGKFLNVRGGGTYRGRFISEHEYTLEWSGQIEQHPHDNASLSQNGYAPVDSALMQTSAALYSTVATITGDPLGDTLPDVHQAPHAQIEAMACPSMPDGCTVRAIYIRHLGIYLDDTLDLEGDPFARSILLHELVHHAQAVMARYTDLSTCEVRMASEAEAYEIQSSYLRKVKSPKQLPPGIAQVLRCPTEVKTRSPYNASYQGEHRYTKATMAISETNSKAARARVVRSDAFSAASICTACPGSARPLETEPAR